MSAFADLVDDALTSFWRSNPVTASFAGETSYDALLPPVPSAASERVALASLAARLATTPVPAQPAARLDARFISAFVEQSLAELATRPRTHDPAWYTGEAAFGIISLLLRDEAAVDARALRARIASLPAFFESGRAALADLPVPGPWIDRARGEARALAHLLRAGLAQHPWAHAAVAQADIAAAVAAARRFAAALDGREEMDPACGREHLALVMRCVHGLQESPEMLERRAAAAFDEALATLEESSRRLEPSLGWRDLLARAAAEKPAPGTTLALLQAAHERALAAADLLLTPATEYALTFAPLPDWARDIASELYFLLYRSPAARRPGRGSIYWSLGEPSVADAKLVHAVHHGSIGHHTQNARARTAASRFARIAGTDGALGLALLGAGTLVEGWACYAEDLLAQVPDFYTDVERVLLEYFGLRTIACCLADLRLHTGAWSLADMQRFYRDEVGFAPARVVAETVRNSIFPGSRLMYWIGMSAIAALRKRSPLGPRAFHDRLLSFGAAPVAWLADELAA